MNSSRQILIRDWDHGDYISGSVLEGRIDWGGLDELEQHAMSLLEEWNERVEFLFGWSGGLDSLVIMDLLYRMGLEPDTYHYIYQDAFPSHTEYTLEMAERYDVSLITDEGHHDIDWLQDHEHYLWPMYERKLDHLDLTYRRAVQERLEAGDYYMYVSGDRNENNTSPEYIREHPKFDFDRVGTPIRTWKAEHVIAYIDRRELPIPYLYRMKPSGTSAPWYRERLEDSNGNIVSTEPKNWHKTRRTALFCDYTSFWTDYICDYYPEAESKAVSYAASEDLSWLTVEEGYEHGADARPVVPSGFSP